MIHCTKTLKGRKLQFQHDGGQTNILLFPFPTHWMWNIKARHGVLFMKSLYKILIFRIFWLPGMLDLRRQRTTNTDRIGNGPPTDLNTTRPLLLMPMILLCLRLCRWLLCTLRVPEDIGSSRRARWGPRTLILLGQFMMRGANLKRLGLEAPTCPTVGLGSLDRW